MTAKAHLPRNESSKSTHKPVVIQNQHLARQQAVPVSQTLFRARSSLSARDVLQLQHTLGNAAVARLLETTRPYPALPLRPSNNNGSAGRIVVQAMGRAEPQKQSIEPQKQSIEKQFGGVRTIYARDVAPATTTTAAAAYQQIELHVDIGANADGTLFRDLLAALRWGKEIIVAAEGVQGPGRLILHPEGAAVIKMTMQMFAEAFRHEIEILGRAKSAREARKSRERSGAGDSSEKTAKKKTAEDKFDAAVVEEHILYLKSLVGVQGLTIGARASSSNSDFKDQRTALMHDSGYTLDMLAAANQAARDAYEALLRGEQILSLDVEVNRVMLDRFIDWLVGLLESSQSTV